MLKSTNWPLYHNKRSSNPHLHASLSHILYTTVAIQLLCTTLSSPLRTNYYHVDYYHVGSFQCLKIAPCKGIVEKKQPLQERCQAPLIDQHLASCTTKTAGSRRAIGLPSKVAAYRTLNRVWDREVPTALFMRFSKKKKMSLCCPVFPRGYVRVSEIGNRTVCFGAVTNLTVRFGASSVFASVRGQFP